MTEIRRRRADRYYRQRYLSLQVHALFAGARRVPSLATLCHEHVKRRAPLVRRLLNATDGPSVAELLGEALSRVVTCDEHEGLAIVDADDPDCDGWERYRRAKIAVFDRREQRWL